MSKLKHFIVTGLCAAIGATAAVSAHAWDLWDAFKTASVDNARVVDRSDERKITTSEGQSYALFFALAADDRTSFDALLSWTEQNLSGGDITKTLPAWLWGEDKASRSWKILDTNNAADSDMWIAYNLLEAGRLWKNDGYTAKGRAMLELLKKKSAPLMVLATSFFQDALVLKRTVLSSSIQATTRFSS